MRIKSTTTLLSDLKYRGDVNGQRQRRRDNAMAHVWVEKPAQEQNLAAQEVESKTFEGSEDGDGRGSCSGDIHRH